MIKNKSNYQIHSDNTSCSGKYHPSELDKFLPWACVKLGTTFTPVITRVDQIDYSASTVNSSRKTRTIESKEENAAITSALKLLEYTSSERSITGNRVKISLVYNNNSELIKIKLCKNKKIPICFLKLLSLAFPYQTRLTGIQIDGGLKPQSLIDFEQIIAISNITEVVLDNTNLKDACVYVLLENAPLKHLSLARCMVDDKIVEALASKLNYPMPASKTLSVLNLSSNGITDTGAKCLGNALRSNRQLAYLNLLGNMIAEAGADSILNSLQEFVLTSDELKGMKLRHFLHMRQESEFISKQLDEMGKISTPVKKKATKAVSSLPKKKKIGDVYLDTGRSNQTATTGRMDDISLDAVESSLKNMFEPFEDPFKSENTLVNDGVTYCLGNNALTYLSLAYNNLNYFNVKKLCTVLQRQRKLNRQPRGLVNVCIEGNEIPSCEELKEINSIIEAGLKNLGKMPLSWKKKLTGKTSIRSTVKSTTS